MRLVRNSIANKKSYVLLIFCTKGETRLVVVKNCFNWKNIDQLNHHLGFLTEQVAITLSMSPYLLYSVFSSLIPILMSPEAIIYLLEPFWSSTHKE
uniref:Uncharacterized protein n=1 Tax=Gracilariopsis longissima TaxID=172976 RepID=A0A345UBI9_9FLOR|nr:hypothetical protein [Gracilariopsis longissima]AXI97825.1 hypothetical protein [Gracilariopsis longissima]